MDKTCQEVDSLAQWLDPGSNPKLFSNYASSLSNEFSCSLENAIVAALTISPSLSLPLSLNRFQDVTVQD